MPDLTGSVNRPRAAVWPLYAGGFIGPFGGAMLNSMLPELARGLGANVTSAGVAITAYLLPFAVMMPFSGVLASRWGAERTVRRAYVVYAVASVVCALAPTLPLFCLGRAVQGLGNAFTTPLLITMIAERVPRDHVGRSLGTYTSMQAAGMAFAPFVGGLAAGVDYRWAFVAIALVGALLTVTTPGSSGTPPQRGSLPWRPLANLRLAQACVVAFCTQVACTGIMFLSGLFAADTFGLPPAWRGLLIAGFGLAGLASGRIVGALTDRVGVRRVGFGTELLVAAAVGLAPWSPHPVALAVCIAITGAAATGSRVMTNTFALRSTPENRQTATALTLSVQFLGSAVAPALLPFYETSAALAFGIAAALALGGALLTIPRPR